MARKPHSTSLILLLVCIFAFWWGISVLAGQTSPLSLNGGADTSQNKQPLTITETKSGNTYTYSGTYEPARPCDALGSGISFSRQNGGEVTVLLTTTSTDANCAQAATADGQPFSVAIAYQGAAPTFMGATLNGQPLATNLIMH